MHIQLALKVLILLAAANGTPIAAKYLLGRSGNHPIDCGLRLHDGRHLFGPSKTIRGILCSLLATTLVAVLIGLSPLVGAMIATCAMVGDLLSSFVKRRLGVAPSEMCLGLDQIPESLLPCLVAAIALRLTMLDIAVVLAGFFLGDVIASRILFRLGVRDRPI